MVSYGGCLCGFVRYQITGEPLSSSLCFCRSCRRASGAPAVAWFVVHTPQYQLLAGKPAAHCSSEPVIRTFCPQCGTPLSYQNSARPAEIDITTVTLDEPEIIPPAEEIWLSHKISWSMSDRELPHFSEENPQQ